MGSMKKYLLPLSMAVGVVLLASQSLFAGDIEWSGLYRIEGFTFDNLVLDSALEKRKEYAAHTLILRPKIVAADGIYINAQLNIFNNQGYNQMGAYLGDGPGHTNGSPSTSVNDSSAQTSNERSVQLLVSQYYLTVMQENGAFIAGRIPFQFGLGITYNSGSGLFDHFADTRDAIAYKIQMGNFFFMPMWSKIAQGQLYTGSNVTEIDGVLEYDNLENGTSIGVIYANRNASDAGNDTPAGPISGYDVGATNSDTLSTKNFNVFFKKDADDYKVGFELGMQGGTTGIDDAAGANVKLSGFAAAIEYEYGRKESRWSYGFKGGYVTGDDPKTHDQYEGFIFSRNYDVGMMLFNHQMGQADVLHTSLLGRKDRPVSSPGATTVESQPDIEAISNVYYFAPSVTYRWNDHWSLVSTLVTGFLDNTTVYLDLGNPATNPYVTTGNNLGYEVDFSLHYKISDKIMWLNEFGYFAPGNAWAVSGQSGSPFATDNVIGFQTRAAVSFQRTSKLAACTTSENTALIATSDGGCRAQGETPGFFFAFKRKYYENRN